MYQHVLSESSDWSRPSGAAFACVDRMARSGTLQCANEWRMTMVLDTQTLTKGRLFVNQTYHYETLRTLGYIGSGGAEISEVLETVKAITEGDAQSWYAAWEATADRAVAQAERTDDPMSKSRAYFRAHNYQRT